MALYDKVLDFIKSPELKTLTLGSNLLGNLLITWSLEELSKKCKKLKELKIINAYLFSDEDEIKKMFPDCNVEIKECKFPCKSCGEFPHNCDCINVIEAGILNNHGAYGQELRSMDRDSEQNSSSESSHDADEINDIFDN